MVHHLLISHISFDVRLRSLSESTGEHTVGELGLDESEAVSKGSPIPNGSDATVDELDGEFME